MKPPAAGHTWDGQLWRGGLVFENRDIGAMAGRASNDPVTQSFWDPKEFCL